DPRPDRHRRFGAVAQGGEVPTLAPGSRFAGARQRHSRGPTSGRRAVRERLRRGRARRPGGR
ncbi:MAG: hypothetical protein AVDCRST_MAG58-2239, partial [uncultured Rubrobacteraceae bacterium]